MLGASHFRISMSGPSRLMHCGFEVRGLSSRSWGLNRAFSGLQLGRVASSDDSGRFFCDSRSFRTVAVTGMNCRQGTAGPRLTQNTKGRFGFAIRSSFREYSGKTRFQVAPVQPPRARQNIPYEEEEFEKFLEKELAKTIESNTPAVYTKKKTSKSKEAGDRRWKIVVGDKVYVRFKPQRGKISTIKKILRKTNQIIVADVNVGEVKYFDTKSMEPVLLTEEKPIDPGMVMLIDPESGKPTRSRWAFLEDGKRVRQSVRSGALIPYPTREKKPVDTTVHVNDTQSDVVLERSYSPE